ncbi:polysaccharide deacetylase family protein [Roseiconus nitratireducens]|uniref:Polysaccharide deacetylase family protein n=1 Tax=Roseiconus nitratireducens TaxID=2605748 RepID=A0A5M6DEN1_9BACT|nr:polysaccharide deacetylase family protein [Roseiconus nitratireducens]KAA5546011.1 polysaccharide deacetylase family protein [Roseiconus nitratireducens]
MNQTLSGFQCCQHGRISKVLRSFGSTGRSFRQTWLTIGIVCVLSMSAVGWAQDPPSDSPTAERQPIPERLVVLTFDDSSKSHYTVVRPLLMKYGFGATFFITEGWDFATNKEDYLTWEQIRQLHDDGFEIGNHTRDHLGITEKTYQRLPEQLEAIEKQCQDHGIPKPVTFAWPGNARTPKAFNTLKEHGILFARRGGAPEFPYEGGRGVAFQPGKHHPYLLPSAGDARPDWDLQDFIQAVQQAKEGRIAILQFHGVPDTAHDWVSSRRDRFEAYLHYLASQDYQVIALRDLAKYVDPSISPTDQATVIRDRNTKEDGAQAR